MNILAPPSLLTIFDEERQRRGTNLGAVRSASSRTAFVVQFHICGLVQLVFPKHSDRIVSGELSADLWLAGASIVAELLNTPCLSF